LADVFTHFGGPVQFVPLSQLLEFVANHWILVLALVVVLGLLAYDAVVGSKGSIEPLAAVSMINQQNALVVDVRPAVDFAGGHIINAINIPMSNFTKQINALEKHRERPIIINCRSGAQSSQACNQLRKQGFATVYNLRGGLLAWQSADLPITRSKSR
jgi:rhodanese-related sulfurtransferase